MSAPRPVRPRAEPAPALQDEEWALPDRPDPDASYDDVEDPVPFGAVVPDGAAPPGGPPCWRPVTSKSLLTRTWTSPFPLDWITCTTYEPSASFIACSTVPGYLAVVAALSFVSDAPVTGVPICGGAPLPGWAPGT